VRVTLDTLIHRDIKPANIMILERGGVYDLVKMLGFGLVREVHQSTVSHVPSWTEREAKLWWDTRSAPCRDAECADDESYQGALEIDLEDRVSVA